MTAQEKLTAFIQAYTALNKVGPDTVQITESTALEDLSIDSLDAVELQMYLEEQTGIIINDPSGPLKTVKDLLNLIPA